MALPGLWALLAAAALAAPAAGQAAENAAEAAPAAGVPLRASPLLQEHLPPQVHDYLPIFLFGERLWGQADAQVVLEGAAELRRHDIVIRADRLEFDRRSQEARALGQVRVNRSGDRFSGPELLFNVQTQRGHFEQPEFSLLDGIGLGDASRIEFLGEDQTALVDARYSTCPRTPGAQWRPDWLVRAARIDIDHAQEVGRARGAVLEFLGVPILAAPFLSFPISDKRKSGLLPPTFNIDNISGIELTLPYYLNLAPNFDATLYPTFMSRRGLDFGAEFRYLQPHYSGQLRASVMPSDRLRDDARWGYSLQHQQRLSGDGLRLFDLEGPLDLRLNINRVSDDDYWRDFPRSHTGLTARLLASEAVLNWTNGPWAASAGVHQWQTLQDLHAPIVPPYDRLPSLALRYTRNDARIAGLDGWDWSLLSELTRFQSDPARTHQVNGTRALALAQIGRRWQTPGWFVHPRAQWHSTHYRFDAALADGSLQATRSLPTLSLDSGLVFERSARYFGRPFTQTLEPRAFFTWTPYRDQRLLPNYDSAVKDFNFSSIFSENAFGGHDRISDTRALTVGASSRLLDPDSGAEVAHFGLAQRYLLRDQNVFLPRASGLPGGDPVRERLSDTLLGARIQWSPLWSLDANVQFNHQTRNSVRSTLSASYTPGPFRSVSAAYRLQRGVSEQVDLSWQWPLSALWGPPAAAQRQPGGGRCARQWYSVGRINYSVTDGKVVDLVAGFEYDAGCWIARLVLEQLQRGQAAANQRVLFQLELNGFSRLGSNPLQVLREHVPRYQPLREEINPPSRFHRYD
ncbi:MAG: LPS-assembly protein LptD [Hydrogenophaga sp.]|nr:LPS-assembly protein LptD [Hydrogenophaga sp.]